MILFIMFITYCISICPIINAGAFFHPSFRRSCKSNIKFAIDASIWPRRCATSVTNYTKYEISDRVWWEHIVWYNRHDDIRIQHVVHSHEGDILNIAQKLGRSHVFQPLFSDCSVQIDRDVRDVSTQTSAAEISHPSISSKPAAECSDYKPKKGEWNMYYCGRPIPYACSCRTVCGNESHFGCQQGICGPSQGHNYPDCMKMDLKERNLPLQGYMVHPLYGWTTNFGQGFLQ